MSNQLQTNLDTILQDKNTNLLPENLKQGVTCLGVEGTMQAGIDTSDATAVASEIKFGKTAYVNGEKITGTVPEVAPLSVNGVNDINLNEGLSVLELKSPQDSIFRRGDALRASYEEISTKIGLTSEKLVKGNTILGIEGVAEADGIDTSDATATENDITMNKTAYVNGNKITGTLSSVPAREFNGLDYVEDESKGTTLTVSTIDTIRSFNEVNNKYNIEIPIDELVLAIGLTADKIKAGETILGVTGTYTGENVSL